ncbi:MAG: hypothetical protein KAG53_07920 [Endozoicomonadaceae bacterium]|nr:hypothetical protein [Endozoicomonadaceae bacterium]
MGNDNKADVPPVNKSNGHVVDLFTGKAWNPSKISKIIRMAPELDGLEMLYSNDANPDKLFSMKILCWVMNEDGEVDAMVPWLSSLVTCRAMNDPLNGRWEGYYDSFHETVFYDPPIHKVIELESSASYYATESDTEEKIIQEIPDTIGTHAVLTRDQFQTIRLAQVTSWRLLNNGLTYAMLADSEKVDNTPILIGDDSLYPAQEHPDFKYFFHHLIANKIKVGDPEAMEAFSRLMDL